MGNDTTTDTSDATSTVSDPQVETTTQGASETQATTTTSGSDEIASLKAALKKANDEAKSHRLKAKELDDLKAKAEADKLSETERLQKQLADLQKTHDETRKSAETRLATYEVQLQAASLGVPVKNLDKVAKLLRSDIEFEDGQPTNVKVLLDALLKDMPELLGKTAASSGGATNPSRSSTSGPQEITQEYVARLKPADYAAMSPVERQRISDWIKNGGMLRR